MIDLRRQFLLLVLFALSVFVGASLARAETIPATSSPVTEYPAQWWSSVAAQRPTTTTSSAQATCDAVAAIYNNTVRPVVLVNSMTSAACLRTSDGYVYASAQKTCPSGGSTSLNVAGVLYQSETKCFAAVASYSCPSDQNWTLSGSTCTRLDCESPQTRNPATGVCEAPACTSKSAIGADAYYDYGANPGGSLPQVVCVGGCIAIFSGTSPAASAVVNGVKHYFAFGGYDYAGSGASSVCTPGVEAPAAGASLAEVPVSHCAPDQIEGLINGKLNCWNVPGSGVTPEAAPTDAPVTTATTSTSSTVTDGATTTTTNITNNIGGGQTTVITACTAGNCTTTTTETKPAEDPTEDPEGSPVAGSLGAVGELAQADERTFQSVWAARKAEIMATPLIGLATSLTSFPGTAGACPSWSVSGSVFGQSIAGDISPPCWIWDVLRAFMLITTLFSARRLIFGG